MQWFASAWLFNYNDNKKYQDSKMIHFRHEIKMQQRSAAAAAALTFPIKVGAKLITMKVSSLLFVVEFWIMLGHSLSYTGKGCGGGVGVECLPVHAEVLGSIPIKDWNFLWLHINSTLAPGFPLSFGIILLGHRAFQLSLFLYHTDNHSFLLLPLLFNLNQSCTMWTIGLPLPLSLFCLW